MLRLFRENFSIALDTVKKQLLRTLLTILIIGIGIMALVGILTVVSALEGSISSNFAVMGANTFNINQYELTTQTEGGHERKIINPLISYSDSQRFKEHYQFPFAKTSVFFTASTREVVKHDIEKTDAEITVLGVDDLYLSNSGLELGKGRNFMNFDRTGNSNVCIVGSDFEKGLLKNKDPLDKIISIRGVKFKVIGVLKEKGSTFGNSDDLRVFIPIPVARAVFSAPNTNYTLSIMVGDKMLIDTAIDQAVIAMRNVRGLRPLDADNFGISRSDDLINRLLSITKYLTMAAWGIGIITIFGSSIALMNIMFVSVAERTQEIGVRKALGAKRTTIAYQFFTETILVGQLGGLLGIILGILIGFGVSSALHFAFVIPWGAILSALFITFIVAVFSGLYPAIKAAYLDPIEALRYE